jgi:hypothetical protein
MILMTAALESKCTMTGCGKAVTHRVSLALPYDVALPGGEMNKGALADAVLFPACADHADHIAKVFYGAAHALSGAVTASEWEA